MIAFLPACIASLSHTDHPSVWLTAGSSQTRWQPLLQGHLLALCILKWLFRGLSYYTSRGLADLERRRICGIVGIGGCYNQNHPHD